jgi:hypothetical protein
VKGKDGIGKENLKKKVVRATNRNIALSAFFLLLSFILWYLDSRVKEVEAGINYQVKYINLPGDKITIKNLPSDLNLFLKGTDYSILKLKISGRKAPVFNDISKVSYKIDPGGKTKDFNIETADLSKSQNVQMLSEFEIT